MKKQWKTKTLGLAAAAIVLVGSASVHEAMAYFTTYVTAKGGYQITVDSDSTIEEEVKDMTKHITISNTGDSDCYVRVKLFSGSNVKISYSGATDASGKAYWSKGDDDYWYYKDIVPAGGKTEQLLAKITLPQDYTDDFDVIVIQECTPVLYNSDGSPYADWDRILDTKTDIGTVSGEEAN